MNCPLTNTLTAYKIQPFRKESARRGKTAKMELSQFKESLAAISEYAKANGYRLKKKDIELCFFSDTDNEDTDTEFLNDSSAMRYVYAYLNDCGIQIEDLEPGDISPYDTDNKDAAGNTEPYETDAEAKTAGTAGSGAGMSENDAAEEKSAEGLGSNAEDPGKSNAGKSNTGTSANVKDADLKGLGAGVSEDEKNANTDVRDTDSGDFSDERMEENSSGTDREQSLVLMYMREIEQIPPLDEAQKNILAARLSSGDDDAVKRLSEHYLPAVCEAAMKKRGHSVAAADLIQEGNLALLLALSEYTGKPDELDAFVREKIDEALDDAIMSQDASDRIGKHLADRVNDLDILSGSLARKLGRTPTVRELAEQMHISEEEADTILRTSLNALTLPDQGDS